MWRWLTLTKTIATRLLRYIGRSLDSHSRMDATDSAAATASIIFSQVSLFLHFHGTISKLFCYRTKTVTILTIHVPVAVPSLHPMGTLTLMTTP
jgi:hypothetical protein